mgnify:CR=1 FL=1
MFNNCVALKSLDLSSFDTANVTDMNGMFFECKALKSLDLSDFDTANVTDMSYMFDSCYNVEFGALALYQQASTQSTPPQNYNRAFKYCGRDTTTGAAELAQIPASWDGTAA